MHCLKTAGELLHRSFNRESVLFERFALVSAACVSCKLQVRSCQSCDIRREEYQRESRSCDCKMQQGVEKPPLRQLPSYQC